LIWSEEHEGQTSGSEGARPRSGTRDGDCFGVRRHMTPKRTQICYRTCHPTDAQVDGLLVTTSANLRQARTCRGMHHESFSRIDFVAVSRTPLLAQKAVVVQPESAMLQTPKELPRAVMEFHRIQLSTAKRAIQRNGVRGCHGWEASIMFSSQPAHAEGFAPVNASVVHRWAS